MLHDDYLCLVESGKQQIKEVRRKFKRKTWKQRQLLSESGFVLRIAPPSFSRDRRIKMKKSINLSFNRQKSGAGESYLLNDQLNQIFVNEPSCKKNNAAVLTFCHIVLPLHLTDCL